MVPCQKQLSQVILVSLFDVMCCDNVATLTALSHASHQEGVAHQDFDAAGCDHIATRNAI